LPGGGAIPSPAKPLGPDWKVAGTLTQSAEMVLCGIEISCDTMGIL